MMTLLNDRTGSVVGGQTAARMYGQSRHIETRADNRSQVEMRNKISCKISQA